MLGFNLLEHVICDLKAPPRWFEPKIMRNSTYVGMATGLVLTGI